MAAAAAAAFLMINESLVAFSVVTHHGMGNNSAMRTEMSLKKARGPGRRRRTTPHGAVEALSGQEPHVMGKPNT